MVVATLLGAGLLLIALLLELARAQGTPAWAAAPMRERSADSVCIAPSPVPAVCCFAGRLTSTPLRAPPDFLLSSRSRSRPGISPGDAARPWSRHPLRRIRL
ncbi:MAG TPA: hypothetical protein VMD30_01335 [Tepidisphaeraceae bacterium]|nr:hypothetical protein [Tepidisphaeraceae bacterium]